MARQVTKKTLNIRGNLVSLEKPAVMAILNTTPDSFHAESRIYRKSEGEWIDLAGEMIAAGATFLDVGGYSTRPGAAEVTEEEETDRVVPVIAGLKKWYAGTVISVDTFRPGVARAAVAAGADIINDVSGGDQDARMFGTVAELKVPYILMHMRGTPATMNSLTHYDHLIADILGDLQKKVARLRMMGVPDVIIDPGFGFAKNVKQNFSLLRGLEAFRELECPLLVGLSRKTMIWKTLGITPGEALNGTTVLNTYALTKGADILRVHDVKEAAEAIRLLDILEAE